MEKQIAYSTEYKHLLDAAIDDAWGRNSYTAGPYNLLFAIISNESCVAHLILRHNLEAKGSSIEVLQKEVNQYIGASAYEIEAPPSFSKFSNHVIEKAADTAACAGFTEVGSDHLLCVLLSIILPSHTSVAKLLKGLGFSLDEIKHEMESVLMFWTWSASLGADF